MRSFAFRELTDQFYWEQGQDEVVLDRPILRQPSFGHILLESSPKRNDYYLFNYIHSYISCKHRVAKKASPSLSLPEKRRKKEHPFTFNDIYNDDGSITKSNSCGNLRREVDMTRWVDEVDEELFFPTNIVSLQCEMKSDGWWLHCDATFLFIPSRIKISHLIVVIVKREELWRKKKKEKLYDDFMHNICSLFLIVINQSINEWIQMWLPSLFQPFFVI